MEILFFTLLGYLLGSIPFGFLLTKYSTGEDIRESGSGNIGATNVLRSGKKTLAGLTLFLDGFKAWLAVFIALQFTEARANPALLEEYPSFAAFFAGLGALLGHVFPVWLKFKGGKGVATYFGMLLGLNGMVFLVAASIWLMMFGVKRISSLAALTTIALVPGWMIVFTDSLGGAFLFLASLLVAWRHHENIERLRQGEEQPFGAEQNSA